MTANEYKRKFIHTTWGGDIEYKFSPEELETLWDKICLEQMGQDSKEDLWQLDFESDE